nr:MAG TPA: hypothetical protein [Caudoviricetes sp.]
MVIFPCVGVSQLFQWRGEQRWQLRLLLVGGSEQPEQRSQPELQLVEREPVEQQQSGVRVWGAFFPRIYPCTRQGIL